MSLLENDFRIMEYEELLINEVSGSYYSESPMLAEFQDKDTGKRCSSPKQMPVTCKKVKTRMDEMEEIRDDEDIGLGSEASQSVQTNNYMTDDVEDGKIFEKYLIQAELEASAQKDISCKSDCFENRINGEESLNGELSLSNGLNVEEESVDVCQKSSISETVHPTVFGSKGDGEVECFNEENCSLMNVRKAPWKYPETSSCKPSDGEVECFNEENCTLMNVLKTPWKYPETSSCKPRNVSVTKKTLKKNAADDVKAKLKRMIMGKHRPIEPEKPPEKPPNIPNFDLIEG